MSKYPSGWKSLQARSAEHLKTQSRACIPEFGMDVWPRWGDSSLRDGGRRETAKGASCWSGCPHQNQAGRGLGLGRLPRSLDHPGLRALRTSGPNKDLFWRLKWEGPVGLLARGPGLMVKLSCPPPGRRLIFDPQTSHRKCHSRSCH